MNYKTVLLLVVMGVVALVAGLLGADKVATRVYCGTWPHMSGDNALFEALSSMARLDVRGFVGDTSNGCQLPTVPLFVIPAVLLVALVVVVVLVYRRWDTYMHSPARLRREILSRHEVIAGPAEVKREVGEKVAIKRGRKVRPEFSKLAGKKFCATDAAFKLGVSQGQAVFLSLEDCVMVIGPPRSGKGFTYVISDIIDAPGPVVTTSTRGDNMAASILARSRKGPVWVFDPSHVTGRESTLKWSPIIGCEDGDVAKRRAELLVEGTGLGAGDGGNNQEFATKAVSNLQALLHAAAIGGESLSTLYGWTKDPEQARDAVQILDDKSTFGWADGLRSTINLPADQRSAAWFGVEDALGPVDVPDTRALFDGRPEEMFDIDRFLAENGTLYLISPLRPKGKSSGVGVLLVMLLDAITERAHQLSQQAEDERLDPPLSGTLDEIANIFAWPALPSWMGAGSGEGICMKPVFQNRAQSRVGWGQEEATTMWDNAGKKFLLGGSSSKTDLEEVSGLVGERTHRGVNASWGDDHESHSTTEDRRAGVSVDELRRMPEQTSFLIGGRARAMLVDMIPWTERPFAEDVKKSLAWHKAHRTPAEPGGLWPAFPVHGLDAGEEDRMVPLEGEELTKELPEFDDEDGEAMAA